MKKILLSLIMLLFIVSGGFCQRITSTTDYFNVPTANVIPQGNAVFTLQGAGDKVFGEDNNLSALLDIGVTDRLQVTATSNIENFGNADVVGGIKFVAGPADSVSNGGQVALFLYNIHENRTMVPGVVLSAPSNLLKGLSYSIAGWCVNEDWEGGVGLNLALTKNINFQTEYSTIDKAVFGVNLSHNNLFGEVRYIDYSDEFYGAAGLKFNMW